MSDKYPSAEQLGSLSCSFCGKTQREVEKLIAGPGGVYICNECTTLCSEICAKEPATPAEPEDYDEVNPAMVSYGLTASGRAWRQEIPGGYRRLWTNDVGDSADDVARRAAYVFLLRSQTVGCAAEILMKRSSAEWLRDALTVALGSAAPATVSRPAEFERRMSEEDSGAAP